MIEAIITSSAIGLTFAEYSGIPQSISLWLFRRGIFSYDKTLLKAGFKEPRPIKLKPFTCGLCLSFWIGFLSSLLYYQYDLYTATAAAFSASLVSVLIKSINDRINR